MSRGGGSRRSMIALNGKGNMTRDTSKRAVWMDTVQTPIGFIYFTHQPMGPVPVKQTPLSFPSLAPTSPHSCSQSHSHAPLPIPLLLVDYLPLRCHNYSDLQNRFPYSQSTLVMLRRNHGHRRCAHPQHPSLACL